MSSRFRKSIPVVFYTAGDPHESSLAEARRAARLGDNVSISFIRVDLIHVADAAVVALEDGGVAGDRRCCEAAVGG